MDQIVCFIKTPVSILFIPVSIKPDTPDFTIIGQQFGKLSVHEIKIFVPVAALGAPCCLTGTATRIEIILVPVELRMIKEKLYTLFSALLGKHFKNIFFIWCAVNNIPIGNPGVEHGKSVMMLACNGDIFHA